MNVSVLGCGRWGSFLSWYSNSLGYNTTLWARKGSKNLEQLKLTRANSYLTLDKSIELTNDLEYSIKRSKYIIISISAQHLRNLMSTLTEYSFENKVLILCMKGIEVETGKTLTQIVKEFLPNVNVAVWVGPGHVQSFTMGIPNCMLIDSDKKEITEEIINVFSSSLIRLYIGNDLLGAEIGAAAKNVIGIAAGILDGIKYSSMKGSLMARGAREISRLIKAMGGNELTAYGLSHLGDYEATLFSEYSHNRKYGECFITGEYFPKLAEGVDTAKALKFLSEKYNVEMPICRAVYSIILKDSEPKKVLSTLFERPIKNEF